MISDIFLLCLNLYNYKIHIDVIITKLLTKNAFDFNFLFTVEIVNSVVCNIVDTLSGLLLNTKSALTVTELPWRT